MSPLHLCAYLVFLSLHGLGAAELLDLLSDWTGLVPDKFLPQLSCPQQAGPGHTGGITPRDHPPESGVEFLVIPTPDP
eukprot:149761-Pelagomonas_calceolata.AAC.1